MKKTVAVIGAGSSGLPSIKACKEEGIDVVCYEGMSTVGGIWKFREEDVEGVSSVMKSTIINSNKEISSFSDFPPPENFPNYMHNTVFSRYLDMYAEKFNLIPHIKFQHWVTSVRPADDYEETGKWLVTAKDLVKDEIVQGIYDGVMSATGHHAFPLRPTFPGEEIFKGTIIHSHSYKTPKGYEDKDVMVVGVGNSGGDLAVELSSVSKKVYLSTRRGCWVLNRVGKHGRPIETYLISRLWNLLYHISPYEISCWIVERTLNQRFDHALYQLKPKHRILSQHPMINDALPNRILSGTVVVKGSIKQFVEDGVIFEGEDSVTKLDAVILATGYEIKFPYIPQEIVPTKDCMVELYKFVFPPHLKHSTLGMIGLVQPVGGLFPMSELQARWFVQVMMGKVSLPSVEAMVQDIKNTQEKMRRRYYAGTRHTVQVDYIDYLDDIASQIGAKPNLTKLLFTDPYLFWMCFFGLCLPYQYRLQGPNTWSGARDAIINYEKRLLTPLKTRHDLLEKEPPVALRKGCVTSLIEKLYKIFRLS